MKEISEYGSYDALTIWHIASVQIKQAEDRGYGKFLLNVTEQISDIIHDFCEMELNGILVNKQYLIEMKSKNSVFSKKLYEINEEFKSNKNAIKTNKKILKLRKIPSGGLFGENNQWLFDISTKDTQQILFFDVLDLKQTGLRKDGGGKTDKKFQATYASVEEVKKLKEYNKIKKLKSTYIDGIFKKMVTNPDAQHDGRLRSNYFFQTVLTGRAAAADPGFHQIPTRGDLSKLIKEQFIPSKGMILTKCDYKAHEVANWGIVSNDKKIFQNLEMGLNARREYRLCKEINELEELAKKLEKTDPHIINVKFFYNKDVTKDHPLRNAVKSVVFGVMYGKQARSLSIDINGTVNEAKELIEKMFQVFQNGGKYIQKTIEEGRKNLIIESPTGRVRHLYGHLHYSESVHAAMDRRGPNSIIQGLASDIGFQAIRILSRLIFEACKTYPKYIMKIENAIHDANMTESLIEALPLSLYLTEHAMTTQVHKNLKEKYGFKIGVGFDIDMEIGATEASLKKWDLRPDSLVKLMDSQIDILNDRLKYGLNKKNILKAIETNSELIWEVRKVELKKATIVDMNMELFGHKNFNKLVFLEDKKRYA
jgi:DNA polymerase I-like protein with 3'-5' exonuclease and polymerase domains